MYDSHVAGTQKQINEGSTSVSPSFPTPSVSSPVLLPPSLQTVDNKATLPLAHDTASNLCISRLGENKRLAANGSIVVSITQRNERVHNRYTLMLSACAHTTDQ
ncbi:unnamed protein product [Pleuronectes platessa]|uniref:Uncharacterized protein n=1 Tax=Pleuronectes platessa TaxID=8262 RepID=A0A9N7UKK0_PLEPL|nr:unnamed protein product [Pleuronectes platessa]